MNAIEIKNLRKEYKDVVAVKGLSLESTARVKPPPSRCFPR